jgi:ATP-dependent helicase/nuclease subunit B
VGEIDADELVLLDARAELELLPALPPLRRHLLLARLVLARNDGGRQVTHEQAVRLAAELTRFLDEVATESTPLERLDALVQGELASHWQQTLEFLKLLAEVWPEVVADQGRLDPAERRNRLLAAWATRWEADPPATPVIAAGITGSIPAVAGLLGAVARLPRGLRGPSRARPGERRAELGQGRGEPPAALPQAAAGQDGDRPGRGAALAGGRRGARLPGAGAPAGGGDAAGGDQRRLAGAGGALLARAARPGDRRGARPRRRGAHAGAPDPRGAGDARTSGWRWSPPTATSPAGSRRSWPAGACAPTTAPACRSTSRRPAASSCSPRTASSATAAVPLLSALKHPLASGGPRTGDFRRKVRALERVLLRGPAAGRAGDADRGGAELAGRGHLARARSRRTISPSGWTPCTRRRAACAS